MAFKLVLSSGHGLYTAGKRCLKSIDPNETREWWLNDRIADRIEVLLAPYDIDILRVDDTTGKIDVPLKTRSDAANAWKADFYLAIHHNAGIKGGTGGGITAFVYNGSIPQSTLDWQKELYNELIKLTGLKGNRSNGCPRSNLHECREPYCDAVLLELGFMDSRTDVPIILTQDFAYKCAQACANVIIRRANLKKKTTTTTTVGSTYKLVTEVNRYASAADAQAKINSKGKYAAGTYYIFNKYPNGLNGMYNISTDKTGASAGSWINPSENKIEEQVKKLYRVRKTWADTKSQVGAYSSLDNAKDACQKAGAGYKVFDWNGKQVYAYVTPVVETKPVEPTQPETSVVTEPKKVYELDFPVKHIICEKTDKTVEDAQREFTQVCELILKNNSSFDIKIAKAFFQIAPIYGIDPTRTISQSILETGWFKYQGSAVKPEHHNYCGLGVTITGIPGNMFNTIEDGVRAQLQHLFAYGSKDDLPDGETLIDKRFKYVTRGISPTWEELAGRWAVPGFDGKDAEAAIKAGNTYGQKIDKIYQGIISTSVSTDDIKKYFPDTGSDVDDKTEDNKVIVEKPIIDEDTKEKVNFIFEFIKKLIEFFTQFLKK